MFTIRGRGTHPLRSFAILFATCCAIVGLVIMPSHAAQASDARTVAAPAAGTGSPQERTLSTPSARTTGGCSGNVRCWVNLNRAETWALGWGPVPPPPGVVGRTPVLAAAYYALAYGHRYIARGYYNRGQCVQFYFSAIPWEGRGMHGLRC